MKFRGNTLSDEQEHCLGEYSGLANGELLRIEAGAGASKTFTLNAIATLLSANQSGLYLAYNTEIVAEVKSVFPAYVDVCTVHGLAYRYIGRHFESRLRDTITLGMFVRTFGVNPEYGYESSQLAYHAIKTVERFCVSADISLGLHHARGGEVSTQAADLVLFYAKRYWNAMTSATEQVPIFHDVYLKMFALALCRGRLSVDYQFALLDEGQDSVAVVRQIFHYINAAKKVVVGDRFQSIYQWRYAIDALEQFSAHRSGQLTTSYRFGDNVAQLANATLRHYQNADTHFVGAGHTDIVFDRNVLAEPVGKKLVICRTNSSLFEVMMEHVSLGMQPGLRKSGELPANLLHDIQLLKNGQAAHDRRFNGIRSFDELQSNIDMGLFSELKPLVRVVDKYGYDCVVNAMQKLAPHSESNIVLSTPHAAKGLECDTVVIHSDFDQRLHGGCDNIAEESNLLYVALTRVKKQLDITRCTSLTRIYERTRHQGATQVNSKRNKFLSLFGDRSA